MHYRKRNRNTRGEAFLRTAALCLPMLLLLTLLSQTASAKTYVITDGQRVFTYTTNATDPVEVLDEAGLQLEEMDTYTTDDGSATTAITVCRAQRVTVDYLGEVTTVHTNGETVGSLLATLNILLEPEDQVNFELNDETRDGLFLQIRRVVTRVETYTASVPHGVSYCYDASLPEGTEVVLVEGRDGELLCTADVTYVNGVEDSRYILSKTLTRCATEEVIAVGTGEKAAETVSDGMPVIEDGYIILPTGEVLTYTDTAQVRATAYTHTDAGCDLITATGSTVHIGTVAVDPRYIPYGTRMFIVANDGSYVYGISEAEDCGGAIKGDRVDLYFPTYNECMAFGWRNCTIYFLG